jgi:type I restriction enzyme S subunit
MTTATMPNIDLTPHNWSVVKHILLMYVPNYDVWAFGSRATWTAKAYSDLDLAVITDIRFSLANMAHLQAAFEESDLSIKVDVVDWSATSDAFREIIRKTAVVVQKAQKKGDGVKPSNMKMTDYGAFAADYAVERLASLCVPDGGVQTGPFGSQLHQEDYVVAGTPIITVEHLGNNRINHQDLPRISDKDRDRLSKYHLRAGDIVFSRVGSVDRRALVRGEEDGWLFSGRCLRVRPDNAKISSEYLSYFFGHPAFKEHIRSIAVGATMPSLNTQLLSGIFVPYPKDLKEQRAIAHILGTLDDKIELNRRMNETLEALARALFKSWFVDFEPVRAKVEGRETGLPKEISDLFPDSFDDSELGEVPKGWRVGKLGEVIQVYDSKRVPLSGKERENRKGVFPYCGAASVMDYIDAYLFDGVYLLMGEDRSVINTDGTPVLQYVWDKFWVNNHAHVIQGKNRICTEHVMLHMQNCNITPFITGAVQLKLNQGNMNRIDFIFPTDEVSLAFSQRVSSIYAKFRLNTEESRTLATLRDTLLPKLLSGEIRVKDAEKIVGGHYE